MKIEVGKAYPGIFSDLVVNLYVHEIHVGAKGPKITFSWAIYPDVPTADCPKDMDWTYRLQRSGQEFKRYLQAFEDWEGQSVLEVEL
jgi:hypothetical protein